LPPYNSPLIKIKFYGAAGCVTGSMHFVEIDGLKFLVDAGYFQGKNEEKNQEFPEEVREIPYIFLTHAHLDHVKNPLYTERDLIETLNLPVKLVSYN